MKSLSNASTWAVAGLLGLGCATDDEDSDGDFGSDENACEIVEGQTYLSKEEKECGISPEGDPATCHWRLEFDNGAFDWRYSDLVADGTYSCDGSMITGTATDTGDTVEGVLDPDTGDLEWDGVMYEPES